MTRTALVTGAHGFVGRYVVRRLARAGFTVKGLGHGTWTRDEWRQWGMAEWHSADVNVDTLLTYAGEPELIVHCAGSGSVAFSMTHPFQDYQRTVATTLSVLEFMRLHCPGASLVVPSSAGVYGVAREMPIRVDSSLFPVSPYGLHKKMAEDLCASYALHFRLRCALVRLFSVYGTGLRKQLLWDACQKLANGNPGFGGTGDETRDWIHVDDAAELLMVAGRHASPSCPIVNGGTGVAVSIRDVTEAIAAELPAAAPPDFAGRVRPGDPTHYLADISGALEWGWRPDRDWREGVTEYVQWYRRDAA